MGMRKNRLSIYKQERSIEHFVSSSTARTTASLCGVNRKTAAFFFLRLREHLAHELDVESEAMFGEKIEVDESYFGGRRKGKWGRYSAGKVPVFGLLKRGGKVFTKVVRKTKTETLMPLITKKIAPDSLVYTDSYRSYNALDVSDFYHERINHSTEFAKGMNYINGIENFWNQTKRMLRKYNGIPKNSFPLFLKECEFRFNYDTPKQQLKILKDWADI